MASSVKLDIVIPESHRVELTLPEELPTGPAEVIVLPIAESADEARARQAATEHNEKARSLADLFAGYVGLIDSGGRESLSRDGGEKLSDYLEAKRRTGHL